MCWYGCVTSSIKIPVKDGFQIECDNKLENLFKVQYSQTLWFDDVGLYVVL